MPFEIGWPSEYSGIRLWATDNEQAEEIVEHIVDEQLDAYRRIKEIAGLYASVGAKVDEVTVQIGAGTVTMSFEEFERLYGIED